MPFSLVVADLDGTLRAEGRSFSQRVRGAVARAQATGVKVVIATGRTFRTALPFAKDLGLTTPIICDHGATIREISSGQILFEQRMPLDLARQVIRSAPPESTLLACLDEEFLIDRWTEEAARFVGPAAASHLSQVPNLAAALIRGPQKLVFVNEADRTTRLFVELTHQYGEELQIVQSNPRYVELTHPGASKGNAVAWLAGYWSIPQEQVIAIGDQGNDLSMIRWAGLGIAMGNGVEQVKQAAGHVTLSAEEDGVAEVIEQYILGLNHAQNANSSRK